MKSKQINFIARLLNKLHKNDPDNKEILSGGILSFIIKLLGFFLSFLVVFMITRIYGTNTQGLFALSLTVVQFSTIIAKMGLDSAIVKFIAESNIKEDTTSLREYHTGGLLLILVFGIIVSAIVYTFSDFVAVNIFSKPELIQYIKFGAFSILPFALVEYFSQSFRGLKKIGEFSFFQFVSKHLFLSLGLLCVFLIPSQATNVMFLFFLSISVTLILCLFYWGRNVRYKFNFLTYRRKIENILLYSIPLFFVSSFSFLMSWIDQIMLGIFNYSAEAIGVYNVSFRFSFLLMVVLMSTNSVLKPKIAEFYGTKDFERLKSTISYYGKIVFFASAIIFFVLLASSFFIYPRLFTDISQELLSESYWVLLFLCCGQYINAICGSTGVVLTMTGMQKIYRNIIFVAVILKIVINIYLIQNYGIIGASLAGLISLFLINITSVYFIKKKFGVLTIYNPLSRK